MVDLREPDGTEAVENYVDGAWQTPTGDDEQALSNPATTEPLGSVTFSSESDIDEAVRAGNEAFEEWSQAPVEERIQPLFRLKTLLEEHQDELAELLVQDHGKTLAEARGELRRGIENVEVACGIPSMMQSGSLLNAAPEIDESAVRKPLGVFAAITPFNFPGMIPLWFLPYAVATGNSFILKPSEQNPLVATRLFELIDEAGFPDGVVQLVNGGVDTVNGLIDHEGVEGISFVGSTPVAKLIYERAAANGKRVQAQGGAKNHIIVTETADLEFAAEKTVSSACACAGERCLANDIVLVEDGVYEEFTDLVVEETASQVVGNGLNEETDIGALISEEHEQRVRDYIDTGVEEGATVLLDGRDAEIDGHEDGNFLAPTVFGDVSEEMTISQEEIFGPVLGLASVDSVDDAIERMNRSRFGNAASLFTGSGADARKFRHEGEIGNLGVNVGTSAPMAFFHFGGWKDSFFGDLHAQGEDMIHFYTDKAVYIERWPDA
ncbi:CoA-acylating methylmalonate-semialdehyde dehydrogenase [Natronorubrum daqingense]|uniref:methylmalonate-semialdehyde dehydrogenase (CoA acylating) n=1 Tax=Natronorubrum daqingense TaxID=588898 RepID=A0A1N7ES60_9EURY|nr:CoA-acylating methylmalonate-semialdehyde dehydrogenase [Natronorubrum daqingense]APX97755.1 methylmalonate-semialdehyde dehydrogenase (CoA acylating) [Natronorubrum daqingense]SIR90859.1 malonate-semialdehyde dehydrogenase (acetylating) / methylmalonate-semialdehyde dehydrogenase [Natronorubrum daqingense]